MNENKYCILLHKDRPIAHLTLNADGSLEKVNRVFEPEFLPLPAKKSLFLLKEWLQDRAVPSSRHSVDSLLKNLNLKNTNEYMLENLALSLTDSYWIRPAMESVQWKDVNLFENDFMSATLEDDKHFNQNALATTGFSRYTPDATLKGDLKKKWLIRENGIRCLVKGNFGVGCQQSINEKFVSLINQKQMCVPYVDYSTTHFVFDDKPDICCVSDNFITSDKVEFVCAYDILQGQKTKGSRSVYYQFLHGCEEIGLNVEEVKQFLGYQIMLDYLVTNPDRHFNNFGILRDTDTLRGISMAPIYDTGSSLLWDVSNPVFSPNLFQQKTNSFLDREEKMLRYVGDYAILDLEKLPTDDELYEIYSLDDALSEERIEFIMCCFQYKKNKIEQLQFHQSMTQIPRQRKQWMVKSGSQKIC